MPRAWLLALMVGTAGLACLVKNVHPGQAVLRRRCASCHTVPRPDPIRRVGLDRLLARHRVRLEEEEVRQLRAFIEASAKGAD